MQIYRQTIKFFTSLTLATILSTATFAAEKPVAPDPEKVLAAAERIRNPQEDYTVTCELTDDDKGKIDVREYQTMLKGRDKALIHFKKPATDIGKQVLMIDNDMWFYTPTSAKPLRISPKQRLAGNASYGDIARLNFTGNYKPSFVRFDKEGDEEAIVLSLVAIEGRPVTYTNIQYWVGAKSMKPLKAEYQTMTGKTLKLGYFEKYEQVFGASRPTVLRLVDKINNRHVTTLNFKNTKASDLPAILFEKQNLGRGG
jgi:outer membrane lipoprotein-sorting protein